MSVPNSYDEIRYNSDKRIWDLAIKYELESMQKNNAWIEVPYNNQKLIDTKWIFCSETPTDITGKARLVAQSYQTEKYGDTYAAVANIETVFLNRKLEEEIYIKTPKGYRNKDHVLRVLKALYGLKQVPSELFARFCKLVNELGFARFSSELCLSVNSTLQLILI